MIGSDRRATCGQPSQLSRTWAIKDINWQIPPQLGLYEQAPSIPASAQHPRKGSGGFYKNPFFIQSIPERASTAAGSRMDGCNLDPDLFTTINQNVFLKSFVSLPLNRCHHLPSRPKYTIIKSKQRCHLNFNKISWSFLL